MTATISHIVRRAMSDMKPRKTIVIPPSRSARIAGCLLGGAVGDALGAPIEFLSLDEIRKRFGPAGLTDYAPAYGKLGAITDDTQMTLFTAEGLLRAVSRGRHKGLCHPPTVVYFAYLRWLQTQGLESAEEEFGFATQVSEPNGWLRDVRQLWSRRGPGRTCLAALQSGRPGGVNDFTPINDSKGCGGVMRAAPAGIVGEAVARAFQLGCETSAITHGHPTGWLAGGALAVIVHVLLNRRKTRRAVDEALRMLRGNEHSAECTRALENAIRLAEEGGPSAEKLMTLGKGWVAEEALAIGVYAALVSKDFREGVLLAVNHGGDSDSTGSIAGNILGTALGRDAIPASWLDRLELKDAIETMAKDLSTKFRSGDEWWARYPGW